MIAECHAYLSTRSPWVLSALIAVTIAIVAAADYLTGPFLSFSIFYVAPVSLAAWYGSRATTVLTCLASTAIWLAVELTSIDYPHELIPIWNAAVRLGFFAITSALLIALKTSLQKQRERADVDGLTSLLNRRAFIDRCQYLFQLAERQDQPVAVGYLDIDRFKAANDEFGHRVGDQILTDIADNLAQCLRRSDIIGRIGGDEFAFLLPDSGNADANLQAKRTIARLRRAATARGWPIGFSLGVVVCRPPLPDFLEALNFADEIMYEVKRRASGGFIVREFEPAAGQHCRIARRETAAHG